MKLKADLTREISRLIAAELAPLRARLEALESTAIVSHETGKPVELYVRRGGAGV